MTDVIQLREAAILPNDLPEGVGHYASVVAARQPLTELTVRGVNAEMDRLFRLFERPTPPNLLTIAKALGAAYFVGTVSSIADSVFEHELQRIPVLIVHSINVAGTGGQVLGNPEAAGPNTTRWTSTSIAVRSTATGRYAFFVI